jgi:hypothetical protein
MDEDVVANIRARVERCRRLAASTTDRQVATVLLQMAVEGEADLTRLSAESRSDDGSAELG